MKVKIISAIGQQSFEEELNSFLDQVKHLKEVKFSQESGRLTALVCFETEGPVTKTSKAATKTSNLTATKSTL